MKSPGLPAASMAAMAPQPGPVSAGGIEYLLEYGVKVKARADAPDRHAERGRRFAGDRFACRFAAFHPGRILLRRPHGLGTRAINHCHDMYWILIDIFQRVSPPILSSNVLLIAESSAITLRKVTILIYCKGCTMIWRPITKP